MGGRGSKGVSGGWSDAFKQQKYPSDERIALYDYTVASYINKEIADSIKNGTPLPPRYIKMKALLDKAINKGVITAHNGKPAFPLFRGGGAIMIGVPEVEFTQAELVKFINDTRIGTKNPNVGYSSVTTKQGIARGFSIRRKNPIVMDIKKVGKGIHGAAVSGQGGERPISGSGSLEEEIIGQRNIIYTPIGKAYIGTDARVHVPVRIDV